MSSIPADLLKQAVTLATPSKVKPPEELVVRLGATNRYTWELKWDGVRALTYVDSGQVLLRSRTGQAMEARYPEVVDQLAKLYPRGSIVLDAELICFDPSTGLPSFNRMQKREAQSKPTSIRILAKSMPATLMAFDLLWHDGTDFRAQPLTSRLAELRKQEGHILRKDDTRVLVSSTADHPEALWRLVNEQRLEGLIAKDRRGRYTGRRDSGWVKVKRTHRCTAIVTGYEPGKGARRGKIGALLLSVLDDAGVPVPIGKAGSGLSDSDHGPFLEVLNAGQQFLAEIEFLGLTPGGELRMPVFVGVRSDVTRDQCVLSQVRF